MSPWWHSQPPAGPAPPAPLPVPAAARVAAARAVTYLAGQGITDPVDIHAIARLWTTQEWRDHTGQDLAASHQKQACTILAAHIAKEPTP